MEDYTKHWPEFMKDISIGVALDNWEVLDGLAKQYNKELEALLNEKIKQDLNYLRAGLKQKWDLDTRKKNLGHEYKEAVEKQLEKYRAIEVEKEEKLNQKQDDISRKRERNIEFKEQKEDIEKDQSEQTKEEKLLQEEENAKDITGMKKESDEQKKEDKTQNEPDKSQPAMTQTREQNTDLEEERAKFIAEMKAAQERIFKNEHERQR